MGNNGADRGLIPTREQKRIIPRVYDRAAAPRYSEKGDIHALAVLADKDSPPAEWHVSTPSHDSAKRWYWFFLAAFIVILFFGA